MRRGLLASREELKALRERIATPPFDAIFDRLLRRCDLILESMPLTEPHWRALAAQGQFGAALQTARTSQGRMLDLLIAHHLDRNFAYRDRAIEELQNLLSWSTWVDPSHPDLPADLTTGEAATAVALAADWLWEDLCETDQHRVREALRVKAIEPYLHGVAANAWWYDCYHNWNTVVNGGIGLAALALSDEDDDARKALGLAEQGLRHFFDALGREGGWDEGTSYWGYAMRYALLYGEARRRVLDDGRVLFARGMDATGQFPVYFTPNGQATSFGDAPGVPLQGALYLFCRDHGRPELLWWLDTYTFQRDLQSTGWSMAGMAMLFRPVGVRTPDAPPMDPLKVFHAIGWAALADHWPRPSLYVAAKTGDLSANHSQRDMNSLQIQAGGEILLTDPGSGRYSPEYFSDRRNEFYEVQARAHNTITIGEEDHRIDAQGQIADSRCDDHYRWVLCDSGEACGLGVTFLRHVVLLVDPKSQSGLGVVVLDEVETGSPEKIELFWHTRGTVELSGQDSTGTITGQRSALWFALRGSAPIAVEQTAHNSDHILHVTGGAMERTYLLSVFAPARPTGPVGLAPTDDGGLRVRAGLADLTFRPVRRRLELTNVELH